MVLHARILACRKGFSASSAGLSAISAFQGLIEPRQTQNLKIAETAENHHRVRGGRPQNL